MYSAVYWDLSICRVLYMFEFVEVLCIPSSRIKEYSEWPSLSLVIFTYGYFTLILCTWFPWFFKGSSCLKVFKWILLNELKIKHFFIYMLRETYTILSNVFYLTLKLSLTMFYKSSVLEKIKSLNWTDRYGSCSFVCNVNCQQYFNKKKRNIHNGVYIIYLSFMTNLIRYKNKIAIKQTFSYHSKSELIKYSEIVY